MGQIIAFIGRRGHPGCFTVGTSHNVYTPIFLLVKAQIETIHDFLYVSLINAFNPDCIGNTECWWLSTKSYLACLESCDQFLHWVSSMTVT